MAAKNKSTPLSKNVGWDNMQVNPLQTYRVDPCQINLIFPNKMSFFVDPLLNMMANTKAAKNAIQEARENVKPKHTTKAKHTADK